MSDSVQIYSGKDGQLSICTDVSIAQNEPLIEHIFNRNACKLLNNDLALQELYKRVFSQLNISSYSSSAQYSVGDLVWYSKDGKLYLLKCISFAAGSPAIQLNAIGHPSDDVLVKSGWENQNKYLTILDYGIADLLQSLVESAVSKHQEDLDMHPNGIVNDDPTSSNYIGNKLLKKDMQNIDPTRSTVFFPYVVQRTNADNVVMTGYMRDFGNVLEYDYVFKLASFDQQDRSSLFVGSAELSANTLALQLYTGMSQNATGFQDNEKYFHSSTAMDIFSPQFPAAQTFTSKVGLLKQANRNGHANTYSATILFKKPFADRNYMVFANSVLCQTNFVKSNEDDHYSLTPSQNDIVVCNKTRESITLLNIVFPDTSKIDVEKIAQNGGLAANSFHCKIIGRIGV